MGRTLNEVNVGPYSAEPSKDLAVRRLESGTVEFYTDEDGSYTLLFRLSNQAWQSIVAGLGGLEVSGGRTLGMLGGGGGLGAG